jgi:predicted adenine nucleotide alpha hydrolase (AANH) superfamily ATPase
MKLLLHTCCGPCTIYPLRFLREQQYEVMGYYYRSNIHPYTECLRRQETLAAYAQDNDLKLIIDETYDLEEFLRAAVFREADRCRFCYQARLKATALIAKKGRFDLFTTTLLYSKFQKHDVIRSIGEAVGRSIGVPFYYQDFRQGWTEGVKISKEIGMYRQQYCGCIYSEKERYFR